MRKPLSRYVLLLIPIALVVAGQTAGKYGALRAASGGGTLNVYILLSYLCLLLRGVFWIYLLRFLKLSVAYPLMSTTYLFVTMVSVLLFNERVSTADFFGTACIVIGVWLIGFGEIRKEKVMKQ